MADQVGGETGGKRQHYLGKNVLYPHSKQIFSFLLSLDRSRTVGIFQTMFAILKDKHATLHICPRFIENSGREGNIQHDVF